MSTRQRRFVIRYRGGEPGDLESPEDLDLGGEANQVGAQTEASALAGRQADGGAEEVQDGEDDGRDDGDDDDLLHVGDLAGDDDHRHSDGETLEQILDGAGDEFRGGEAVHLIISRVLKKKFAPFFEKDRDSGAAGGAAGGARETGPRAVKSKDRTLWNG